MGTFLELLGAIGQFLFSFTKDVTEKEIEKNINNLKRYDWFNLYLNNSTYQELINKNVNVRYVIGKFDIAKLSKDTYHHLAEKKVKKTLLKESHEIK